MDLPMIFSSIDHRNLLIVQFGISCVLVGLIWTIQIIHYPGFLRVGAENFGGYHRFHMSSITLLVAPLMVSEALVSLLFLFLEVPLDFVVFNLSTLLVIWLSTALLSVPIHERLKGGIDSKQVKWLVRTNWIRTFLWTSRAIIFGWWLIHI